MGAGRAVVVRVRGRAIACVLAAPEGIAFLDKSDMNLHIVTASVDERLNENAFIVPGLGDAGDRQFGPPN